MRGWMMMAVLAGCTGSPGSTPAVKSGVPTVQAGSLPVWYLAKRIGGARLTPSILIPPGVDPPDWSPTGEQVAAVGQADLIVINGVGYEAWVGTASLPEDRVVDTSTGVPLVSIDGPTHSHGADGEHSHSGSDPHIWADPANYALQAASVRDALVAADAAGAPVYNGQFGGLERQLSELGTKLDAALAALATRPLAANHPSFTYWARRGGVTIVDLALDPKTPPTAERIAEISAAFPDGGVLLWEARPTDEVTAALPMLDHLVLDPLEQPGVSGQYDYVAQMRVNVALMTTQSQAPVADPAKADPAAAETDSP